jgi:hypothetical protein
MRSSTLYQAIFALCLVGTETAKQCARVIRLIREGHFDYDDDLRRAMSHEPPKIFRPLRTGFHLSLSEAARQVLTQYCKPPLKIRLGTWEKRT